MQNSNIAIAELNDENFDPAIDPAIVPVVVGDAKVFSLGSPARAKATIARTSL